MDKTKLEKLARLSGKVASKALGALERRDTISVESYRFRSTEFRAGLLHRRQKRTNELGPIKREGVSWLIPK